MPAHIQIGEKGEKAAAEFLRQKGYKILEQNWRFGRFEIDIIASYNKLIVFVEVKTRTNDFYGHPEIAVSESKQEHIMQAAEQYIIENNIDSEIRFDIISIIMKDNIEKIYHIEDALS